MAWRVSNNLYAKSEIPQSHIISSLPVDIKFTPEWMTQYLGVADGMNCGQYGCYIPNAIFTELNAQVNGVYTTHSSGTNIGRAEWWNDNDNLLLHVIAPDCTITLNNSSEIYNIKIQLKGKKLVVYENRIHFTFSVETGNHTFTFNKLSRNYALPQFNYYIEGLDTKVNFSVEVKQYINPVPNTYNLGDIASDSNNNYSIVARDNTGSSVWKYINIRDLYSSSLVYNLGDLIVNPDDSIDVMYRTDNNIWKRIGTLKI